MESNIIFMESKRIVLVRHSTTLLNFLVEWQMRIIWESEEKNEKIKKNDIRKEEGNFWKVKSWYTDLANN